MGFIDFLLTGAGLAMDACAVSATHGLSMKRICWGRSLLIAFAFALFQGIMPLTGYFAGSLFAGWVSSFANWLAFGLLAFVGGKMIWDSFHCEEEDNGCCSCSGKSFLWMLLVQAVATSIDALAVGFSLAALGANIFYAISVISGITFILAFASILLGHKLGTFLADKAQLAGGVILVLIGIKIAFF